MKTKLEEKTPHKNALKFISNFKREQISDAKLTVKQGDHWDYEHETLEYGMRLGILAEALMRLKDGSDDILIQLNTFFLGRIEHMIKVKNNHVEIMKVIRQHGILKNAVHAVRYCEKEVFEIHTRADEIKADVGRYINWAWENDKAENFTDQEATHE